MVLDGAPHAVEAIDAIGGLVVLCDEPGLRFQFAIWGYALTGDFSEPGAVIAEGKNVDMIVYLPWDATAAALETQWLTGPDGITRHPPEWWCLPWVAEAVREGLAA